MRLTFPWRFSPISVLSCGFFVLTGLICDPCRADTPTTVIAQTQGDFQVNSLVVGSGDYAQADYQAFYLTQLGSNFGGDGSITRVKISQADPNEVVFDQFFTPDPNQQSLNPSALVLDTTGKFSGKMFMGTFGPSLGDEHDGQVYQVAPDGSISLFATAFVDSKGDPVKDNGTPVTGFFDVVDMAISPGGDFGDYIYVLSENDSRYGPYGSDLWRISSDGKAELFVQNITDAVISLAFDNTGLYGGDLFVATYDPGDIYRVTSTGQVSLFFDSASAGVSGMFCDLAFAPADSVLNGVMLASQRRSTKSYLEAIEINGKNHYTLASNLSVGDVSSGDIAFDEQNNLIIAQQGAKNLLRVNYEALIEEPNTIIIDDETGGRILTDILGRQFLFDFTGPGQASLVINQRTDGAMINPFNLTVHGGNSSSKMYFGADTAFNLRDKQNPPLQPVKNLNLDQIVLSGSLGGLFFDGAVDSISTAANSHGRISRAALGAVRRVTATGYRFDDFHAGNLGDPNTPNNSFQAAWIENLDIDGDVNNVFFSNQLGGNDYNRIHVGGIMSSCTLYGRSARTIEIDNQNDEPNAADLCNFEFSASGAIEQFLVQRGDVRDSFFTVVKHIKTVDLLDGSLIGTVVQGLKIDFVYISGAIDKDSTISAPGYYSRIPLLICGGDLAGGVNAARLGDVLIGYDRQRQRRPETEGQYTGSNLTGSITAVFSIDTVQVTGKIDAGKIIASYSGIKSIFVEDGLNNITISAPYSKIQRILTGYFDGDRRQIVNTAADVSGAISAKSLGRLYYTGASTATLPARIGYKHDDVPNE
jgi:hypothetical protein